MKCARCGFENPDNAHFCKECGAPIETAAPPYSAPQSGPQYTQTPPQGYYAPPQSPQYPQQTPPPTYYAPGYPQYMEVISPSSRWVALVLCSLLGCIGVHRFYVGKIGTGILYLFTGGLFGIGWLVDIIMIACGSFTDSSGAQLKQ